MLELVPTGGLCNKMRAIDSAVAFCSTYNIPLKVYWIKDENLINCQFIDLFEPINGLNIYELNNLPFKLQKSQPKNLFLPSFLRKVTFTGKIFKRFEIKDYLKQKKSFKELYDKHKRLVFFSFSPFFPPPKKYAIFTPKPIIQQLIDTETRHFDEFTIGIHIRRTDHKAAIENSPLHLFEKMIEKEISKNNKANFYIASDCLSTKKYLFDTYGSIVQSDLEPGDRTSLTGMYRGIIELYALSRTAKVYGSFKSSFSRTACEITGIELIHVTKD